MNLQELKSNKADKNYLSSVGGVYPYAVVIYNLKKGIKEFLVNGSLDDVDNFINSELKKWRMVPNQEQVVEKIMTRILEEEVKA